MPIIHTVPGLVLTDHEFSVPLDHTRPDGDRITVFAREVAAPDGRDRPFLVFLQGGPGMEAPRPLGAPATIGWLSRALREYRVLLLDQRGTGRSTPVDDLPGMTPQQQADYLTHFRADAIVADAEWIRRELGVEKWAVLGQSFGGFCGLHYLSVAPQSLSAAYFTGGLPPIGRHPDEVYRGTYERMLTRNRAFYDRYPEDRARVLDLHQRLDDEDIRLPGGDRLTSRRMRQCGMVLGSGEGKELLHYLLELPVHSRAFRHDVAHLLAFDRNPLYAVVHESSYADGHATNWSAARTLPDAYREDRSLFYAEHIFPWMWEDFGSLAPLREAAELLAAHEWPTLYDAEVLRGNEVPAAAAVYADDVYVDARFSLETAATVRGLKPWLTNEFEHNGLRASGGAILGRLIDLAAGRI